VIAQRLARGTLRLLGWTLVSEAPDLPKYVVIGAPHTTNWDLPIGMLGLIGLGIKPSLVVKHTLLRPPLGWLLRALGSIPIDRSQRRNFVDQVVAAYKEADELVVALTPEGTRSYTPYWKTGFYYIALGADVPIALAFADYPTRRVGLGPTLYPTGDIEADMAVIAEFYADKTGKRPENKSPIRVRPPEIERTLSD
jgi:1-acyl-sn-glycerol-3-phosphate acyltransferase